MIKRSFAIFCLMLFCIVPAAGFARSARFHDLRAPGLTSGAGTMEFRFKLLKDIASDPHSHVLLLGVSADAGESFEIRIIQKDLIVHRRFARCVLASFVARNNFNVGEWHTFRLTWSGATSRFSIDGREVPKLGLFSSQDLPKMIPEVRLGVEENFRLDAFKATPGSDLRETEEDKEFVKNVVCTDLAGFLAEPAQENYRGVAFRGFSGRESREKIKRYVDILPEGFRAALKNIVYVDDKRFLKGGEGGFADPISGSLVLKGSLFAEPTVFFHEAAHLYDAKLGINIGTPDEQSDWARISGASCYFKGSDMKQYYEEFRKTGAKNGILGPQGGQCASEDLAVWVAAVYDRYLQDQTLAERLNPSSPQYSPKNIKKMDFILKKGFISQDVYDRVTRPNGR